MRVAVVTLALAVILIGGGCSEDLRGVSDALSLLVSSSPLDRPFEILFGGDGPPAQSPSESRVLAAATSLLDHARHGSMRALFILATARLFSTVIPRFWFTEQATSFSVAVSSAGSAPDSTCAHLSVEQILVPDRTHVSISLSSTSGSVVALAVVACVVQSRLAATAAAASVLQNTVRSRREPLDGEPLTGLQSVDPDLVAWHAAIAAAAEGRALPADAYTRRSAAWALPGEDRAPAPDRAAQLAARRVLRVPWVQRFSLRGRGVSSSSKASDLPDYVPVTRDAALIDDLADEFADLIDDSSGALTTLALLHLAAVRVDPGSRSALYDDPMQQQAPRHEVAGVAAAVVLDFLPLWASEAATNLVRATWAVAEELLASLWPAPRNRAPSLLEPPPMGDGVFKSDEAAYEALAMAAHRASGPASLALAFAAARGRLPLGIAPPGLGVEDGGSDTTASPPISDCLRAVEWVRALAEDVVFEEGGGDTGLAPPVLFIPSLWERHEDALSSAADADEIANVDWLRQQAAESGDAAVHYELGELYLFGDPLAGVWADRSAAFRHYQAAAVQGMPDAQARVGALLLAGEGGSEAGDAPDNASEAHQLLEQAADAGSTGALVALGYMLRDGLGGVDRDPARALELLERAAELGSVAAHHGIAEILVESGANHSRALEHYEIASERWFSPAQVALADILLDDEVGVDASACAAALRLYAAVAGKAVTGSGIPSMASAYREVRAGTAASAEAAFLQYLVLAPLGHGLENAGFLLLRAAVQQHPAPKSDIDFVAALLDRYRAADQPLFVPSAASGAPPTPPSQAGVSMMSTSAALPSASRVSMMSSPISLRAAAYGLLLSATELNSHHALTAVGDCISRRMVDVPWCASGTEHAAAAAAAAWYEAAVDQGSGHAAFTLAMAKVEGSFGGRGPSLPSNLTEAWQLLQLVEELDYLAEPAVFLGRAALLWRERTDAGGGGSAGAVWGLLDLLYECASGRAGSQSSADDEVGLLRAAIYGDACVFLARAGLSAAACAALVLLLVSAAVFLVTRTPRPAGRDERVREPGDPQAPPPL